MTDVDAPTPTEVPTRSIRDVRDVRRWIGAAVIAVIVTLVAAAVTTVAATMRTNATTAADETVRRMGERTADLVTAHLDVASAAIDQVDVIANDDVLAERGPELDRILAAQLIAHPQLSGAFVGFPDGAFRFAHRTDEALVVRHVDTADGYVATDSTLAADLSIVDTVELDTDYDPRLRPWYEAAERSLGNEWTEPYLFFRSGEPGVTLARARRSPNGETDAVIGMDVSLSELSRFLDDLPIDEGADAFLIAGATVVAAPASSPLGPAGATDELADIEDIGLDIDDLRRLIERRAPLDKGDGARVHRIELVGDDAPHWSVLIRTERVPLVTALDRRARLAIAAIVLAGLMLVFSTPLLTRWLRRPIEELSRQARVDSLTEVANRRTFLDEAGEALQRSRRLGSEFTLAIIDIDDFKQINDEYGHAVGDEVLQRLGHALRATTRPIDLIGRLGGDELAIGIADLDRRRADRMLDRIQRSVSTTFDDGFDVRVTIGATARSDRDVELADLLVEADQQLLSAKRSAKGTISWRPRARGDEDTPTVLRIR